MRRALFLSLMIHALLLFGVMSLLPARLDAPSAGIQGVITTAALPERAHPEAESRSSPLAPLATVVPKSKPRQMVSEKSPVVIPLPSPALAPAVSQGAADVVPAPNVRSGADSAATSATASVHEAINADDLRQYRISLAMAARRFKRYPALARERGWEGTVDIALTVGSHFPVPDIALARSSGHAVLDRQAQEMMIQAARSTALPESLKGRDFRMLLPVQFSLDGDQ